MCPAPPQQLGPLGLCRTGQPTLATQLPCAQRLGPQAVQAWGESGSPTPYKGSQAREVHFSAFHTAPDPASTSLCLAWDFL